MSVVSPCSPASSDTVLPFTLQDANALTGQMPDLHFNPQRDVIWAESSGVQAYLDFYGINFTKSLAVENSGRLLHGFGAVTAAGFRIATHYWLSTDPMAPSSGPLSPKGALSPTKGTLVIMHGYYDHVGVFNKAIEFGLQQGLAVLAFDLPGHGLSSGDQVAIDSFDQYADVLETILHAARALLPAPYYALGQSTGGAVLLNHLWRYGQRPDALPFSGIALCAPLVLPRAWGTGRWLYALMHRFVKHMSRGKSKSSHDEAFNRFIDEQDCLQSRQLSVRWVGAMKAWDAQFRQFPPLAQPLLSSNKPNKPLLVVQGDEDMTVNWRYNLFHIKRALPGTRIAIIPGARHQLVNETQAIREQIFTEISRYFFEC